MYILEKAEFIASIRHIARFLKSDLPVTVLKSRIRVAEKQEEEEEHRQLQSVFCFTQTQQYFI